MSIVFVQNRRSPLLASPIYHLKAINPANPNSQSGFDDDAFLYSLSTTLNMVFNFDDDALLWARELFYYLKGGHVDYGEVYSKAGHSQFRRIYEQGHYPQWDEDNPIHFVGHSAGAQVIRVLQQMLVDKAFRGYENTSENWVLSFTSLSGTFNGTTRAYLDGMHMKFDRCILGSLYFILIVSVAAAFRAIGYEIEFSPVRPYA